MSDLTLKQNGSSPNTWSIIRLFFIACILLLVTNVLCLVILLQRTKSALAQRTGGETGFMALPRAALDRMTEYEVDRGKLQVDIAQLRGKVDALPMQDILLALQKQNVLVNHAIGKVIPVQMPAGFEKELSALEAVVADHGQWPTRTDDADSLRNRLASVVNQLPAWAETDYLLRINKLRWSVQAIWFQVTYAQVTDNEMLDTALSGIEPLLEAIPSGAPSSLVESSRVQLASLGKRLTQAQRDTAIAHGNDVAQTKKGDASAAWSALEKWVGDPEKGSIIQKLRSTLRIQALTTEADRQVILLTKQLQQFHRLRDEKLRQQGVMRLYDAALSQSLALAVEEIELDSLNALTRSLQQEVSTLGESEAKRQSDKLRAYQQWTLDSLDAFWKVKADADARAKKENYVTSGWNDQEYLMVQDAMCEHLLPVVPSLLDPPVLERFNEAFRFGWQQLDKRPEQTEVAKKSVTIAKHLP